MILDGKRPDGRGPKDLRTIKCEVGVLPRAHGSAIFQRGETQALVTTVLGTAADEQRVDGIMDEYSKKFMLDYNMPPFAVGEIRPIRGPGRREIGHGALAERSVAPILPVPAEFPYTIRVISDILESNGSSSMASVCGATLSLMDAGVPITDPVGGISIGLVQDEETGRHVLLTDIIGDEDHFGDMDFKVAGTQRGITGIQLDLKNQGITEEIIRETLDQAREARLEILRAMLRSIKRPREEISSNAPRLIQIQVNPEKIGLIIGPGGKTIRRLQDETGAKIDIDDSGVVTLSSPEAAGAEAARDKIVAMTEGVQIGRIYEGRVTSIKEFGAFVEILPGKDGLVHISELSEGYVGSVTDICRVGDPMPVKAIAVDDQDRVKLSRKAALAERGETDEFASRTRPAGAPIVPKAAAPADLPDVPPAPAAAAATATEADREADRADAIEPSPAASSKQHSVKRPRGSPPGAFTRPTSRAALTVSTAPEPAIETYGQPNRRRNRRQPFHRRPPAALGERAAEFDVTRRLRARTPRFRNWPAGWPTRSAIRSRRFRSTSTCWPRTFRTSNPRATVARQSGSIGSSTRSVGFTTSSRTSSGSRAFRT